MPTKELKFRIWVFFFSSRIIDSFIQGQRCRDKQKALTREQNEKAEVINRRRERRE